MVTRPKKQSRKYLGARRWGAGNIKNRRGAGSRGGTGRAGKKHKFTRIVKYEKERLRHRGFAPWKRASLGEINLDSVSLAASGKQEVEFAGYKVLGGGSITHPIKVKASAFSKKAAQKITQAGGEAIRL